MDAVQQLKEHIDLAEFIGQFMELKSDGDTERLVGRCIFPHGGTPEAPTFEDDGSFFVFPNKTFYCFGCHKGDSKVPDIWGRRQFGNDVIAFWRELQRQETGIEYTFSEALVSLAQRIGKPHLAPRTNVLPKQASLYRLQAQRAENWMAQLQDAANVRQYLTNRGVSDEVRNRYGLGFVGQDRLEQIRDHVSIPFRHEHNGQVIAFGFRSLDPDADPKYVNSANSDIWKKGDHVYGLYEAGAAISRARMAILTEDYFGPLVMASAGVTNVVGGVATSLTDQQIKLLRRRTDTLYWWMEDDKGLKAFTDMAAPVLRSGMRFFVIDAKMDADEFALAHGMDRATILTEIRKCASMAAVWLVCHHWLLCQAHLIAEDSALQSLAVLLGACARPADRAIMGREIQRCFNVNPALLLEAKGCTTVTL